MSVLSRLWFFQMSYEFERPGTPSRPRRVIASPVAIRRGEGAQRKRCRDPRCSPRGNPACRGTFAVASGAAPIPLVAMRKGSPRRLTHGEGRAENQRQGNRVLVKVPLCFVLPLDFFQLHDEEALQVAEKRRDVKGKGEKERYTHLNAEFQRIARGDKKAFLSDQCKEIEENIQMSAERTHVCTHTRLC